MAKFKKLEDLPEILDQNAGVMSVNMVDLRNAIGAGRLGIHVRREISEDLQELRIGHVPEELPDSQWDVIRLYDVDSEAGKLIQAVLTVGEKGDRRIRQTATGDSDRMLGQIRALLNSDKEK